GRADQCRRQSARWLSAAAGRQSTTDRNTTAVPGQPNLRTSLQTGGTGSPGGAEGGRTCDGRRWNSQARSDSSRAAGAGGRAQGAVRQSPGQQTGLSDG